MKVISVLHFTMGLAVLAQVSQYSNAAPRVTQVYSESLAQGSVLTIEGSGFLREEDNPSAIMFDMADHALIAGEVNAHNDKFKDGDAISRLDEDPDTLWWKPSATLNAAAETPRIVRSEGGRGYDTNAHYLLPGYNSFLGWPAAYGGDNTPTDNAKLYVSWYLKMSYDPRYYWAISPVGLEGEFIPGEDIEINGIPGRFAGIGTAGLAKDMLHFEIIGQQNANKLKAEKIRGLSSGASTIFPSDFAAGSGEGYEPPGSNKYIRVWEDPRGAEGLRAAWTQMQVSTDWASAPVTAEKWHLMEFFVDTDESEIRTYVDRQHLLTTKTSMPAVEGKWSPTIALLGFNGKIQQFQDTRIDDIYMDNSFSRVVLSDKEHFSEVEAYELQYPLSWSSGEINVFINYGSLDRNSQTYLYVIDEKGAVNETGYPLCEGCVTPPEKIELRVD